MTFLFLFLAQSIMSYFNMARQGRNIVLSPKSGNPSSSLIWLHGLGDSADGWYDVFLEEGVVPQHTKVILLTAPIAPVTINMGMPSNSWYDIKSMAPGKKSYCFEDVITNSDTVKKYILEEIEFYKGDSKKVFVGGFSQGAAMSLNIGLGSAAPKLGGVIALSGLFFPDSQVNNPEINILAIHGEDDPVIPLSVAETSYERLNKLPNFSFHKIKGLGHSLNSEVLQLFKKFAHKLM